jgi:hypothetical protein
MLFFKLPKKDLATALSQQLPFRLMLGSSRCERHNRRHASEPETGDPLMPTTQNGRRLPGGRSLKLVAGAGFEPATFGL